MVRAVPPSALNKFQGRLPWPIDPGADDWGLLPEQQEAYVEQFRRLLAAKQAWDEEKHDFYVLRRFLRARGYDLEKATAMWLKNVAFKAEWKVDSILTDFQYHEREAFLKAYPQGYHKTDKLGRPVYIQMLGQVDVDTLKKATTEERMVQFHIQEYERCCKVIMPVCSHLQGRNIDQTFGILDVKGVGLSHLSGDVKRIIGIITKYDQDNYPEMLGHICIINAPTLFKYVWYAIKGFLDARTQGKVEILGTNYRNDLLKWVDADNLPTWLGGKSHGSLLDDIGPWSDHQVLTSLGLDLDGMRHGRVSVSRPSSIIGPRPSSTRSHSGDHSVLHSIGGMSGRRLSGTLEQGSVAGYASSLRRVSDALSDHTGYHSPANSGDLSASRLGSFRHVGGMSPDVTLVVSSQPLLIAEPKTPGNGVVPLAGACGMIPEQPTRKAQTLMQRVAALEAVLPQQTERLKATLQEAAGGRTEPNDQAASSSKSAPQGSLLYRVEVLEEAMDTLLAAQQASLRYQEELLTQQRQHQKAQSGCCGCCIS